jgi:hypothetical protein
MYLITATKLLIFSEIDELFQLRKVKVTYRPPKKLEWFRYSS